ncbi:alpha/beta hydrolase family protein [Actinoplanes sp. CA-054009]
MHRRTVVLGLGAAVLAGCSPSAGKPAEKPAPSAPTVTTTSPAPPTAAAKPKPAAGRAPARQFQVGTRRLALRRGADRPLATTVWAPKADGPFPLILFSHGLTANPASYADLLRSWARAGFVVAAPAYPHTSGESGELNVLDVLNQPADASYVITEVLAELKGNVDPGRIAAAGHSAGGITTIGMFSNARDDRLVAGVVLAGRQVLASPFTGSEAPLLFVHGQRDQVVGYGDGRAAYDAVPWPKALLSVVRGGHIATGAAFDVVAATTTDFWRWSLYGDPAARRRLRTEATRGEVATLDDRLR